jgi:hypothetical protein
MVNYKQGKIYKIECNVTGLIYIGSTCKKKLSGRMTQHRSAYKKYLNRKGKYYSAFIVMENNDYDIILIEDFPCNSKDQLFARECYYTNEIECVNIYKNQGLCLELGKKQYTNIYNKAYYKDCRKEYYKEYREKNIDEISSRQNEKFACSCGGKYIYAYRSKHLKTKKHLKYLDEQTEE